MKLTPVKYGFIGKHPDGRDIHIYRQFDGKTARLCIYGASWPDPAPRYNEAY